MARVDLGERIATLREEQALTQAGLAEKARISPSTLSQIESGRVPRPHVGTIRKIARALGVEPQDLRRAEEPALAGKAEASPNGDIPQSLDELLERRDAQTSHLTDANLGDVIKHENVEDAVQIAHEVRAEIEAITPDLLLLRDRFLHNSTAARLLTEAGMQLWLVRFSLAAKRGQTFEPIPELEQAILEKAIRDLQEADSKLVGVS